MVVGKTALVEYKCRECGNNVWARKGHGMVKEQLCGPCYQKYIAQLPKKKKPIISLPKLGKKEEKKEVAGIEQAPTEWMKCPKCGKDVNKYAGKCPYCRAKLEKSVFGRFFGKLKRKKPKKEVAKEEEKPEEGEEKEKKKRLKLPETRGGNPPVLIGTVGLLGALWFLGFPLVLITLGLILLVLVVLQFIFPPWFKWVVVGGMVLSAILLYQLGQFSDITAVIPPAYAEQIEEAWVESKDNIISVYETSKCYTKINPDLVDACLKEIEEKEKEEIANPWKNYETLEVKFGNPYLNYEYENPEEMKNYDLEVNFINKNEKTFDINITDVFATVGNSDDEPTPGVLIGFEPSFVLDPGDEKYVRYEFEDISCDRTKFRVNVTSTQTGGGTSEYAMAPNEENEEWRKLLHSKRPKPIADPGPLNIYAFTYPVGIDRSYFVDNTIDNKLLIIIKIKNPKVDGIAYITDLYFNQMFKFPFQYFNIDDPPDCDGPEGMKVVHDDTKCQDNTYNNCLKFTFEKPELIISQGDSLEIKCKASFDSGVNLDDKYEDFIRVESTYRFTQEWDFSPGCTETTTITSTSTSTTIHEIPPGI